MALGPGQRAIQAARQVLKTLIANGETRLRLAVLELEEERARLLTLILLAGASLLLFMLGTATLTALVIATFWDSYRLVAIGASAAVLLLASIVLAVVAIRQSRRHTLLKDTLSQLATDRALLEQKNDARQER
ncbi:MAG: phage holin family protein [Halomonas sp.]|nr:phage holin family protein [Halomonas sp.]MDN6297201.1 phage holin family protein [Halomonas sp.]MDN6314297.1 phage holin family protein [Halomonas sp.]MDN6335935.1 phage holin family protein [Halomonas sp.]